MLDLCQDNPAVTLRVDIWWETFARKTLVEVVWMPEAMMASLYSERAKACMRLKDWRGVRN